MNGGAAMRATWYPILLAAALAACGDWPVLEADDSDATEWGRLAPSAALDARTVLPPETLEDEAEATAALEARADALRARAATTGLSPEDRAELDALLRLLEARDG